MSNVCVTVQSPYCDKKIVPIFKHFIALTFIPPSFGLRQAKRVVYFAHHHKAAGVKTKQSVQQRLQRLLNSFDVHCVEEGDRIPRYLYKAMDRR